ncbi:MAG: hypothetical protein GXX89_10805 [Clostridiales bacterium]|nr:hypothetical protein [Clostridiales bacterium]
MKKALAILLVFLLAVTLVACGKDTGNGEDTTPSQKPAESAKPSQNAEAAAPTYKPNTDSVGWYSDNANWFDREPYKIAFIYDNASAQTDLLEQAIKAWSERINYTYTSYCANSNADAFINTMSVLKQQGYDGMILNPEAAYVDRVKQAAAENDIAWLPGFVPLLDMNGDPVWSQESLGTKYQADLMMNWLKDNYKTYLGDIDTTKLGLISTSQSTVPVLKLVSDFCIEDFKEMFPEAAANAYEVDTVNYGYDANAGYNSVAPFIAAHPEVEYWFLVGSIEDVVQGACRAVDAAGMTDKTVAISCGGNLVKDSWKSGTDTGCYKAGVYYSMEIYAEPLVCGVVAMLDGRATPETLWPEWKNPNQQYPVVTTASVVITEETYEEYDVYVQEYFEALKNGLPAPTPPTN